jgi:hypothetical protein
MELALDILAVAAGVAIVAATLGSAIKTVILPRASASSITRWVFLTMRRIYLVLAPRGLAYERRDRRLATYAPVSLTVTLAVWLILVFVGYLLIFVGVDDQAWRAAFTLSGSSLFTLGFSHPVGLPATALAFSEAAIGLFLLALLITYLPAIYSAYSRREVGVTSLEVRAGSPPSAREMIWRHWMLERLGELGAVWQEWERWFVDVEETHSSLPSLVFFRSPQPDQNWVTAAGAVLDGAALTLSSVDIPKDVQAEFCLRAGYLCLRRIAGFFRVPFDPDPAPDAPISVAREEWEAVVDELEREGVPVKADRDQAWRDFAGWRVNYDTVLLALANIVSAPPATWSSDRSGDRTRAPRAFRFRPTHADRGPAHS